MREQSTRVLLRIITYLDDCALAGNFEHLALTGLAVTELNVDDLCVPMEQWLDVNSGGRERKAMARKLTWGT